MPNIRTIGPKEWDVHPSEEGAAAYERVGRYIGQAWNEMGQAAQGAVDSFAQQEARTQQMNMSADLSKFQMEAHQNLTDYMNKADPSDPQALQKWNQSYFQPQLQALNEKYAAHGSVLDAMSGNKFHDQVVDQFSRQSNMIQTGIMDRATGEWANIQGKYFVQKSMETTNNQAALAHDDPASLQALIKQSDQTTSLLPVDAATRESIGREARMHITDSALDGIISNAENPAHTSPEVLAQAQGLISDPANGYYKNASPGKYDWAMDRLEKAKTAYAGINSEVAAQQLPSLREAARNGNMDAYQTMLNLGANYVGNNPKETALKRSEITADANADWQSFQQTKQYDRMSDKDIQAQIEDFPNRVAGVTDMTALKGMEEARDNAVKYLKTRDEQFKADPVGFTLNHDGVTQSRAQAFMDKPSPETWNNYATAATAYQKAIYPDRVPVLMPQQMVAQFKDSMVAAQNSESGARQELDLINKWSQVTGDQWPQVAHELYAAKALNPAQFGAALAFSNTASQGLAGDMLKASFMPAKELTERALQNQHAVREYDDATAQALAPFEKTMALAPNGAMLGDAMFQSVRNFAMYHGDPAAAAQAVNLMLNTKYDFHGSYRIPKDANLDTDAVATGASRVMDDLPNHKLVNPDGSDMDAYARSGMAGTWLTNNREDGLILYGAGGAPIKERNAQGVIVPVQLKFTDLQKLGQ